MSTSKPDPAAQAVQALEADLGEPTTFRTTGRFLAAQGLEGIPLDSWGLIALTPTRLVFRHYSQTHPLFGGKDDELRWEVPRDRFASCEVRRQAFWARWFSGVPDHTALTGPGVLLSVETADTLERLAAAWAASLS